MRIVCVFAHPDDEAFGPGGTIARLSAKHEIYLLCATYGEAQNSHIKNLGETRAKELINASKILGIKKVWFLGFKDGGLNNNSYHKLADRIEKHLIKLKPDTLITFEPRGISGHIDHVVVSLVTTFVFYKLKFIKLLLYYCISDKQRRLFSDYFIYFPPGYKRGEVQRVFDVTEVWDKKVKAIECHKSQKEDGQRILDVLAKVPKEEYFIEVKK